VKNSDMEKAWGEMKGPMVLTLLKIGKGGRIMSFQDKTGQKVPDVTFRIREDFEWITKTSDDFFKNKRIVLFALPGAFTPTCSNIHLPGYNDLYDCFRSLGIDDVICLSVNDSYVMDEWKKSERVERVTMLPDGNGEFSRKLGFLTDKSDECLVKEAGAIQWW
jgi:peroxiredoxin